MSELTKAIERKIKEERIFLDKFKGVENIVMINISAAKINTLNEVLDLANGELKLDEAALHIPVVSQQSGLLAIENLRIITNVTGEPMSKDIAQQTLAEIANCG